MNKTPWDKMLINALSLGIKPQEFWALSTKEWQLINHNESNNFIMSKQRLFELSQEFDGQ